MARLDGAATACASADTTSKSSERGYTWPTLVSTLLEPEVLGHPPLQLGDLRRVPAEQVELVGGGADRALDAAQRIALHQIVESLVRDEQLLRGAREPLAERGRLRRHVVRTARP